MLAFAKVAIRFRAISACFGVTDSIAISASRKKSSKRRLEMTLPHYR